MKVEKLVKYVSEITHLSMYGYCPPHSVLKSFFNSNMKAMGLDESHTWKPFVIDEEMYADFKGLMRLKDVECPEKIKDIYTWMAWINYLRKEIPYEEHLKHILAEKNALIELNAALDSGDDDLVSQKHLEYIEIADDAMNFLREYL